MFVRPSALALLLFTLPAVLVAPALAGDELATPGPVQLPPSTGEPPVPGQLSPAPAVEPPVLPGPGSAAPPAFVPPPVIPAPVPAPPPVGEPPVPVVAVRVRVPACIDAGQELKYLICADNTSPAAAHHVFVRVPIPSGTRLLRAEPPPTSRDHELVWALGTLPGLACKEIWLVLEPTSGEDIKLCARVQFEHGQCVLTRIARAGPQAPRMPYAEEQPGQPPPKKGPPEKGPPMAAVQPRLGLKISGPEDQLVDQPTVYRMTLTNTGTGRATRALIAADLPAAATFVAATEGSKQVGQQVAWQLGDLYPGAQRTVELTLKVKAPGKACVQASAFADPELSARDEFCTIFKGAPAVLFKMIDTKDPIAVGEETSYVIEVISQGSLPVTNVRVQAIVPDGMALVRTTGPTESHKGELAKQGQVVRFDPYTSLAAGGHITYEVFVKAVQAGDLHFRAILTADQLQAGGPVLEEESTHVIREVAQALPMRRRR
jgi:uncharacterized repeat protein (TIGR01451 family)